MDPQNDGNDSLFIKRKIFSSPKPSPPPSPPPPPPPSKTTTASTTIFDERLLNTRKIIEQKQKNYILYDFSSGNHDELGKRIEIASLLGIRLFLTPRNIMLSAFYWIDNYSVPTIKESDYFTHFINSILDTPVCLRIYIPEGSHIEHYNNNNNSMTPNIHNISRYPINLNYIGGNLHRIPLNHFLLNRECIIKPCLGELIKPENTCFLSRVTDGLNGEINLSSFVFDGILDYFYEPSVIIIISFFIYLTKLITLTNAQSYSDWYPYLRKSIRSIDPSIKKEAFSTKFGCLIESGFHYEERLLALKKDLLELFNILTNPDISRIHENLQKLVEKKLSDVSSLGMERYLFLQSQIKNVTRKK